MRFIESIQDSLGLGKINPELEAYGKEFQQEGSPFSRIIEFYPDYARFRQIHRKLPDGGYLETSYLVSPNPGGDGLIITPGGVFRSDGRW